MLFLILSPIICALRAASRREGHSLAEFALVFSFISLLSVVIMSLFAVQVRGICFEVVAILKAVRATI
ncbi:MAG: hypothetical protein WDO13_13100 [Verrucomicrobiota bacterium]